MPHNQDNENTADGHPASIKKRVVNKQTGRPLPCIMGQNACARTGVV